MAILECFLWNIGALYTRSQDQGNSRIKQSYWWRDKNWS
jgi:hypothetical protein